MGASGSLKWRLLGFLVVLAVAVAAVWWFARPTATVAKVVRDKALNAVPGSVTVLAENPLELKSELAGRVTKMRIEISSKVAAKDVVIELDPTDLNLQIEQLLTDRDAAKKRIEIGSPSLYELTNAKEELAKAEAEFKTGNLTKAQLDIVTRKMKQVEQRLETENLEAAQRLARLENDLKVARRNLERMTIRTPVDGVVTQIYTREGDLINPGQPLAKIITSTRIVEAKISEENFSGLQVGQRAVVRFLSYGADQYEAKVEKILPDADPQTQRYVIYLTVEIDRKRLVPGITGEVSIVIGARENSLLVPRRALFGRNLFVVKDGRVELRNVEIGFSTLTRAEIVKGVAEGELVVVEETDRFKNGDRVAVQLAEKAD